MATGLWRQTAPDRLPIGGYVEVIHEVDRFEVPYESNIDIQMIVCVWGLFMAEASYRDQDIAWRSDLVHTPYGLPP